MSYADANICCPCSFSQGNSSECGPPDYPRRISRRLVLQRCPQVGVRSDPWTTPSPDTADSGASVMRCRGGVPWGSAACAISAQCQLSPLFRSHSPPSSPWLRRLSYIWHLISQHSGQRQLGSTRFRTHWGQNGWGGSTGTLLNGVGCCRIYRYWWYDRRLPTCGENS